MLVDVNFHGVFLWERRDFVQDNKTLFQFMRWKFSEREGEKKRGVSAFMLYLGFVSTLLLCPLAISIFTIYCRAIDGIAKWLCTVVFTTHCHLYKVCNNHIDGQSDAVTKIRLETKQNKNYHVDWILWSSDWLFGFTFLLNFLNLLENIQSNVTFWVGHCFGIEGSLDITKAKYQWPNMWGLGILAFLFSEDRYFHDSTGRTQTLIAGLNSNHWLDICSWLRKNSFWGNSTQIYKWHSPSVSKPIPIYAKKSSLIFSKGISWICKLFIMMHTICVIQMIHSNIF